MLDGRTIRESVSVWCLPERPDRMALRTVSEDASAWRRAVGERVRSIRKAKGLSRAALARGASLSACYLGRIECGLANPRIQTLGVLSAALGVSPAELLGGEERRGG